MHQNLRLIFWGKMANFDSLCRKNTSMRHAAGARVCPMQLTPYDSRGQEIGYLDPDCLKCGKCTLACPTKIMTLKH